MHVRHTAPVAVLSVAFGLLSGCGTSADSVGSSSSAIQGGKTDPSHAFAVGIMGQASGGLCSGALIAPNLVVTARHCVAHVSSESVDCATDKFGAVYPASSFYVTTDPSMSEKGTWIVASKVIVPTGTTFCGADLALIILSKNIPAGTATPVTPGIEFPLTDRAHYSLKMTAIGYGITSVSAQDEGIRRIKENIGIECIPGDKTIDCAKLGAGSSVAATEFVAGSGTCSGDSGSSAYEQKSFTSGTPVSMGVLSRGGEEGDQCVGSVYTRLDSYADLIRDTAKEASTAGGYPVPMWAGGTGEETPDAGTPGPTAGTAGANCASNEDCESSACNSLDGEHFVCTTSCDPADKSTCGDGFTCHKDGEAGVCFPTTAADKPAANAANGGSGGCSQTGRGPTSPVPWIVGLALGVTAFRRRRARA
jgi:Trypsin